ncbi:hypothetical protein [Fluviicola sp.]|uniref:hypothetical protein n=1 Tax=Fluviicola sp. TaxID=1917219 RepID=UPI003D29E27B
MKTAVIILLVLHGAIHVMGFVKAFDILPVKQLNQSISKPFGILWLMACLLCFTSALLLLIKVNEWWVVGLSAILVSQILIIRFWKDAKFGTIANAVIAAILFMI